MRILKRGVMWVPVKTVCLSGKKERKTRLGPPPMAILRQLAPSTSDLGLIKGPYMYNMT